MANMGGLGGPVWLESITGYSRGNKKVNILFSKPIIKQIISLFFNAMIGIIAMKGNVLLHNHSKALLHNHLII